VFFSLVKISSSSFVSVLKTLLIESREGLLACRKPLFIPKGSLLEDLAHPEVTSDKKAVKTEMLFLCSRG